MAIKNCQFDLVNARVIKFSALNMLVELEIQIVNPNPIRVIIDQLDLLLYINRFRTLNAPFQGTRIPPGETRILTTTMRIPYLRVGLAVVDILKNKDKVTFRLDGHVYLSNGFRIFKFPVNIYRSY